MPFTTLKPTKLSCALTPDNSESAETASEDETVPVDPFKLAFSKAKSYKQSVKSNSGLGNEQNASDNSVKQANDGDGGQKELPASVKIAMEKAKKYKQNKGVGVSDMSTTAAETTQGNIIS